MMESIQGLKEVNGKPIIVIDELRKLHPEKFNESGSMDYKWFESEIRPKYNIFVRHDVDSISFNMLSKPASEGGDLNRCQFTDLILVALEMLKYHNNKVSCRENSITITKLEEALMWQEARTKNRIERNVEGTHNK